MIRSLQALRAGSPARFDCRVALLAASSAAATSCTYKVDLFENQLPGEGLSDASSFGFAIAEDDDGGDAGDGDGDTYKPRDDRFPSCDDILAPEARTGDLCSFSNQQACVRTVDASCSIETAQCTDGILRLGKVERESCEFDNDRAMCAAPSTPCCITLWDCAGNSTQPSTEVCAPGCENLMPRSDRVITECPGGIGPGWPDSTSVVGCSGDFVCDSLGFELGPMRPLFLADLLGLIYWCDNGVLQQVSLSDAPLLRDSLAL